VARSNLRWRMISGVARAAKNGFRSMTSVSGTSPNDCGRATAAAAHDSTGGSGTPFRKTRHTIWRFYGIDDAAAFRRIEPSSESSSQRLVTTAEDASLPKQWISITSKAKMT
jgi:hypothetical protein